MFLRPDLQNMPLYMSVLLNAGKVLEACEVAKRREDGAMAFCTRVVGTAEAAHFDKICVLLETFPSLAVPVAWSARDLDVRKRISLYSSCSKHLDADAEEERMIARGSFEDVKTFSLGLKRESGPGAAIVAVDHVHDL